MAQITKQDIQEMVYHWLNTPIYSYLGSDYGSDPKSLLHRPNEIGSADAFIAKMKKDLPILAAYEASVFFVPIDEDKSALVVTLNGQFVASFPKQSEKQAFRAFLS